MGRDVRLTIHLHSTPMLRISGDILLFPLYVFTAYVGTRVFSSNRRAGMQRTDESTVTLRYL